MMMPVVDHPVNDYASVVDETTQFIDVREPDEVAQGTIPGTVNIPLGHVPSRLDELDRERRVVLLCRSGNRSAQAAEFLMGAGFTDVVNLAGGMLAFDTSATTERTFP
jgi:rhodanese-related sulfurtransferase